jgi:flagellar hook-length control protein FliK
MPEAAPSAPTGQFGDFLLENLQQLVALSPGMLQAVESQQGPASQIQVIANLPVQEKTELDSDLSVFGQVSLPNSGDPLFIVEPLFVSVAPAAIPGMATQPNPATQFPISMESPTTPVTISTALSPAQATHIQVEFLPGVMVAGSEDVPNWQLLIPMTAIQSKQLDKTSLPILLVAEQPTSASGQPTLVLPAVMDASNLELPKLLNSLKQLITQVQQPQNSDGISIPEDVESIPAPPIRVNPQRILPQAQIAPEVINELKPVLISAKLTIDAAVLEATIKQAAQPVATDTAKLAPAATALLPTQAPPLTQSPEFFAPRMPAAVQPQGAQVVVATNGAATAFFDFEANSNENFAGLPKQEGETVVPPPAAVDSQIEDGASVSKQIEKLATIDRIENIDRMRIQFSQAQLRTLVQRGEIKLHLSPPELGELRVELKSAAESMTARFEVRSEAARQIVEMNLPHLRESMERAGIRVDQLEVFVSGEDQRRRAQQQTEQQQDIESAELAEVEPESAQPQTAQLLHLGRVNLIA